MEKRATNKPSKDDWGTDRRVKGEYMGTFTELPLPGHENARQTQQEEDISAFFSERGLKRQKKDVLGI